MQWVEGLDHRKTQAIAELAGVDCRKMQAVAELARRGTATRPDIVGHWLTLGRALIDLGEFRDAAARMREAIALLLPSAELRLVLIEALLTQDLFEEALPHAEVALQIAPGHAHAMRIYCYLLDILKCWDKAVLDNDAMAALARSNASGMPLPVRPLGPAAA